MYKDGKKVRPLLLMLFARMLTNPEAPLPDNIIKGAVAVEMLHVATLIHDDIIDGAEIRRDKPTVNSVRGINEAILIGDMQFLQSIRVFTETISINENTDLIQRVIDSAFDTCRGELDELKAKISEGNIRQRYMRIIERKTAALFGLSCEAGAVLVEAADSDCRRAGFYGRRFGAAFQIMDDIFDFFPNGGKKTGMDLTNRTLSLPVILAAEMNGENSETAKLLYGKSGADFGKAFAEVHECGAIERSYSLAREYAEKAVQFLVPFPQNRYTQALRELAYYIVERGV
jgi:heptaprenyl diphosphate synthase